MENNKKLMLEFNSKYNYSKMFEVINLMSNSIKYLNLKKRRDITIYSLGSSQYFESYSDTALKDWLKTRLELIKNPYRYYINDHKLNFIFYEK